MSKSKRILWALVLAVFVTASALPPAWAAGPDTQRAAPATETGSWAGWFSALVARWPGLAAWLAPESVSVAARAPALGATTPADGGDSEPDFGVSPQEGVVADPDG